MTEEIKNKISASHKGKSKSKIHVEKMKFSLKEMWKNKSEYELDNWKRLTSKITKERWSDEEYKKKLSDTMKKHWKSLSDQEKETRHLASLEAGAGVCKYLEILGYKVYGNCEKRYIQDLHKRNQILPLNKIRSGIGTPFGITFPDFEYEDCFVEIKSTYTFKKMLEQDQNSDKSQLKKLFWIMKNIKPVKILVEEKRYIFKDKTDIAILPYLNSTCEYSGLRTVESYA